MRDLIPEDPLFDRLGLRGRRLVPPDPANSYTQTADTWPMTRIVNRQVSDIFGTPPSFYPTVRRDGSGFVVTVAQGAIGYWNANYEEGQDPLMFRVPTLNGVELTADPPPQLAVGANQWVVLHVMTDKRNQITEEPTIEVSTDLGVHALPEHEGLGEEGDDPGVIGRDGEYFIKLFRILPTGQVDHRMFTDPILEPYLWGAKVLGEGKGKILAKFNVTDGRYEFRSLQRGGGILIEQEEEFIKFKVDAENIGDGVQVYVEATGDEAKTQFRSIKAEGDQIRVTQEGEVVQIEGNGKQGQIRFINCVGATVGEYTWVDGLATSEGTLEFRLGDCCGDDPPGP